MSNMDKKKNIKFGIQLILTQKSHRKPHNMERRLKEKSRIPFIQSKAHSPCSSGPKPHFSPPEPWRTPWIPVPPAPCSESSGQRRRAVSRNAHLGWATWVGPTERGGATRSCFFLMFWGFCPVQVSFCWIVLGFNPIQLGF